AAPVTANEKLKLESLIVHLVNLNANIDSEVKPKILEEAEPLYRDARYVGNKGIIIDTETMDAYRIRRFKPLNGPHVHVVTEVMGRINGFYEEVYEGNSGADKPDLCIVGNSRIAYYKKEEFL
ncbi:MAG: hypothetical protein AABX59_03775, partial [Nanoarchaeota archaeon]